MITVAYTFQELEITLNSDDTVEYMSVNHITHFQVYNKSYSIDHEERVPGNMLQELFSDVPHIWNDSDFDAPAFKRFVHARKTKHTEKICPQIEQITGLKTFET